MSAQSNLTLNALTYVPAGRVGEVASWTNKDDSAGYPRTASLAVSAKPNQQGNYKVTMKLVLPEVRSTDSSCGCIGQKEAESIFNGTVTIPASLDSAGRTALYTSIVNALASGAFSSAIEDLEPSW